MTTVERSQWRFLTVLMVVGTVTHLAINAGVWWSTGCGLVVGILNDVLYRWVSAPEREDRKDS